MYSKIMVALDSSECSSYGVNLAVDLAQMMGAHLTGNHVYAARLHDIRFRQLEPGLPENYQSEEVLQHWRSVHGDLIERGLKLISEAYLDHFVKKCFEAGVSAEQKTCEGRNYEQLVKDVQTSGYDLTILGAHGLGRSGRSLIGSVCERVTRLVDCDVLVAKNGRVLDSGKILVAIDGSAHSFAALNVAVSLSRAYKTTVLAVAAYDPFFHGVAFKSIAKVLSDEAAKLFRFVEQEKLHDEIIDKGLANVYRSHLLRAQRVANEKGVSLDINVLEGKPFDAIASYAESVEPSLLVVGRVGIHHGEGVTLGSTAENLLRFADCNVLVVNRGVNEMAEK